MRTSAPAPASGGGETLVDAASALAASPGKGGASPVALASAVAASLAAVDPESGGAPADDVVVDLRGVHKT
jgi:hypothetical protein